MRKTILASIFLCSICIILVGMDDISIQSESKTEAVSQKERQDRLAAEAAQMQKLKEHGYEIYTLKINVKANIPPATGLVCRVRQIGAKNTDYNTDYIGASGGKLSPEGTAIVQLPGNPNTISEGLWQIMISNCHVAIHGKGSDLWLYRSQPFRLSKSDWHKPKEFVIDKLPVYPFIGRQKFQVVDLKGRQYSTLPCQITMAQDPVINHSSTIESDSIVGDADGIFELPLFKGIFIRITAEMCDFFKCRKTYTDGEKEVDYSQANPFRPRPHKLIEDFGQSLKKDGVKKLPFDLGPCLVAKVYETVDGKEQLSDKVSLLKFDDKSRANIYTNLANGQSAILPFDEHLANPRGGRIDFRFREECADLEDAYRIEPAEFKFTPQPGINEAKYLLVPRATAKFAVVDSQTNAPVRDARLYFSVGSVSERCAVYRPGATVPVTGKTQAVLHAPGYGVTPVEWKALRGEGAQTLTFKLAPAPEVKIDFAAEGVTEDGKAQLKVGYDQYPFIPPESFPFDYRRGQGSVTARLDLKRPMTMVVNDLRREMLFPGAVVRHPGGKAPAAIAVKAPAPYVYSGKLEGIVAEAKRPALVFWLPEIPGANAAPIGYVSVSTDGNFAARLAPGVKYCRFLRCPSPDPADKDKSPREADKYYLLEPFVTPEKGAQAKPETVAPGREITRKEAYALIGGWVF